MCSNVCCRFLRSFFIEKIENKKYRTRKEILVGTGLKGFGQNALCDHFKFHKGGLGKILEKTFAKCLIAQLTPRSEQATETAASFLAPLNGPQSQMAPISPHPFPHFSSMLIL